MNSVDRLVERRVEVLGKRVRVALVFVLFAPLACNAVAEDHRNQVNELIDKLESPDWRQRSGAAFALGGIGRQARHALPALSITKRDKHQTVRKFSARAIDSIYRSLETDIPLDDLVKQIAAEPRPPNWIRIPAKRSKFDGSAGLRFDDAPPGSGRQQAIFGGILAITIPAGAHVSWSHDSTVQLGPSSTLKIELKDHVPRQWEEREILSARKLEGRFGRLLLPELPADRRWQIVYDGHALDRDRDGDGREDITLLVVPADDRK